MRMTRSVPLPPLSDGVVTLRPWGEPGDVEALTRGCNDEAVAVFLDVIPQPYTDADARAYIDICGIGWRDGTSSNFAITEDRRAVGSIGVRWLEPEQGVAEVGYWIAAEARGRGLCTRALRLVSRWAIEDEGVDRLQLRADVDNHGSRRVAEKAGFREEGVLRSSRYNDRLGRRVDFVMYSLLPGEVTHSRA
jgi:RimJ/RimL family protein N-acetyltransferase